MAIIKTKRQIQPDWPLRFDQSMGPYASVDSVAASLKQDFIILLQTIPGEWPMRPDLGVGLVTYTFETMGSEYLLDIKTKIQAQLRKYLPNIKLIDARGNEEKLSELSSRGGLKAYVSFLDKSRESIILLLISL